MKKEKHINADDAIRPIVKMALEQAYKKLDEMVLNELDKRLKNDNNSKTI